jgi:pantoate--beta-alanine ligase
MNVFTSKTELTKFLEQERIKDKNIGFVPTMGALHQGHLSLIQESRKRTNLTVCSIYVNPTQFNVKSDLENYPRNTEKDIELLVSENCDVCFLPNTNDVYPNGVSKLLEINLSGLDKRMEGERRSGHFDGVVTVVNNLFEIINPDIAFFGEKDFQQLAVIRKMTQVLNMNVEIVGCPIIREPDGLAMSSRNERLTRHERLAATFIYNTLLATKNLNGSIQEKKDFVIKQFENHALFKLDYFDITSEKNLTACIEEPSTPTRAFIAAFIGKVRLIDNIALNN